MSTLHRPHGFLNLDKPSGMTSHDVVHAVRRAARRAGWPDLKVGHAGTLDPLATGVLIVCVGHAARLSEYVMATHKRYTARVELGITTTTYDREGAVVATADPSAITRNAIETVLPRFTGPIQQIPPIYSAIKQGGRKLYEIARAGGQVDLQPRPVVIDALLITAYEPPFVTLDVHCSAGTYIRSLAHDLGQALGVGGTLVDLRRTASGSFTVDAALSLDVLDEPDWARHVIAPVQALAAWRTITVDAQMAAALYNGRSLVDTG
ncbi:MAG: tRNA pseudouridine(55) synthase TruB, partial [Anaerolinea sp.]|nr:tRNA pseudouridine(55) synthase TruB [Anaerolinea sp.]